MTEYVSTLNDKIIKDKEAREIIGDKNDLVTENKDNIVAAINELSNSGQYDPSLHRIASYEVTSSSGESHITIDADLDGNPLKMTEIVVFATFKGASANSSSKSNAYFYFNGQSGTYQIKTINNVVPANGGQLIYSLFARMAGAGFILLAKDADDNSNGNLFKLMNFFGDSSDYFTQFDIVCSDNTKKFGTGTKITIYAK